MENTRNYVIQKVLGNKKLLNMVAHNNEGEFLPGMIPELRRMVNSDGYQSVVNKAKLEVRGHNRMVLVMEYTQVGDEVIPELLIGEAA